MTFKKNDWMDWLKTIIIALFIAFIVRVFIFVPIVVDGPSMLPTLHSGDQMIVNKLSQSLTNPDRFDVIVFHATLKRDYIKRIIGLPGETVRYENDQLFINEEPIKEPFIEEAKKNYTQNNSYTSDFTMDDILGGYETIPEGYYLVLGDNRRDSTDSRHLGFISEDQMVGKASVLYWPLNRIKIID